MPQLYGIQAAIGSNHMPFKHPVPQSYAIQAAIGSNQQWAEVARGSCGALKRVI